MELSLICPVQHIEWTELLTSRFCLAPVALLNDVYHQYFANASERGYKVTLDNGVFEENKVRDTEYIHLARSIGAEVVVIPDTINATAEANWSTALRFIELIKTHHACKLMFVLQCGKDDTVGFWDILDKAMDNENIQWIGICRDAVYNAFSKWTHTEDQELNRFYFAAQLQDRYSVEEILKKKWHFLGIGAHLDLLPYFWFVDAMDTASLFYQATLGRKVTDEYILPGDLKRPKDYFLRDFSPEVNWVDLLKYNCWAALHTAQQADINRRKITGGRL